MAAKRINELIEPMTLGDMRANGVRSLDVSWQCHHRAIAVDHRRASRGRTGRSRRRRKPDPAGPDAVPLQSLQVLQGETFGFPGACP
jgi:hypothetical protein